MDENYDVRDDYKDGNKGLKDPGRQGSRRPPWIRVQLLRSQLKSDFDTGVLTGKNFFDEKALHHMFMMAS